MRVSALKLLPQSSLKDCIFCHKPLTQTSDLYCCLYDVDNNHGNGCFRINYHIDNELVSGMHVSVWENAVDDNNNKFTLNFDFLKSQTDTCK